MDVARIHPVAINRPTTSGAIPALNDRTLSQWRRACPQRAATSAKVVDGSMMAVRIATAPGIPAA